MLETTRIRDNMGVIKKGLEKRNWTEEDMAILDDIVKTDDERKHLKTKNDQALAQINAFSREIGTLFKKGDTTAANALRAKVTELKQTVKVDEEKLREVKEKLTELLLNVPNIPHYSVVKGSSESDNIIVKDWKDPKPALPHDALPHWELGMKYGILNFDLGSKLTGAGFPVLLKGGARLQRALISFFLNEASKAGYDEVVCPLMVNEDTARATGQLPDKEGQMYHVTRDDLYLIPTAEVPLTNIYRDLIINAEEFPIKVTGYTPCFRREAGSYGSDVKGLNRVHQFDKVEIVQIVHPDNSYERLDEMVKHVEGLLQKLELPYRILRLCGGDLGFTSALTYDFEVFSAAQKKWLEVSSVSNFETFQSHRLKLRFKDENGKMRLVHTLNGSALALARIIAAILENNQTSKGIVIPEVLRQYFDNELIL